MSSPFTPNRQITIGRKSMYLSIGFREIYEFDKQHRDPFFRAMSDGLPSMEAVAKIVSIGVRRSGRLSEIDVMDAFTEHPEQLPGAVNAIGEIMAELMPDQNKDKEAEEPAPLPVVVPSDSVRESSTGTD